MVTDRAAWPRKTRELHTQFFDSSVWNEFRFRPDDVVIASYAKAGTTWTQQIVAQLIFGGREGIDVAALSPWLDMRFPPKEVKLALLEAQQHRRFIKTHLPVDALVFSPDAKYIYVARDGRDVVWSFYNHHATPRCSAPGRDHADSRNHRGLECLSAGGGDHIPVVRPSPRGGAAGRTAADRAAAVLHARRDPSLRMCVIWLGRPGEPQCSTPMARPRLT
jgi:hypothetical protein